MNYNYLYDDVEKHAILRLQLQVQLLKSISYILCTHDYFDISNALPKLHRLSYACLSTLASIISSFITLVVMYGPIVVRLPRRGGIPPGGITQVKCRHLADRSCTSGAIRRIDHAIVAPPGGYVTN